MDSCDNLSDTITAIYVPLWFSSGAVSENADRKQIDEVALENHLSDFQKRNFRSEVQLEFGGVVHSLDDLQATIRKHRIEFLFNGFSGKPESKQLFISRKTAWTLNKETEVSILNMSFETEVKNTCFLSTLDEPFYYKPKMDNIFQGHKKYFVHVNTGLNKGSYYSFEERKKNAEKSLGFKFDLFEQIFTTAPVSAIKNLIKKRALTSLVLELGNQDIPNYKQGIKNIIDTAHRLGCEVSILNRLVKNERGYIYQVG